MNYKNKIIFFLLIKVIIFIAFIFLTTLYKINPIHLCIIKIDKINVAENKNFYCSFSLTWNSNKLDATKIIKETEAIYFKEENVYWNLNKYPLKKITQQKIIFENYFQKCSQKEQIVQLKLKKISLLKYFWEKIKL